MHNISWNTVKQIKGSYCISLITANNDDPNKLWESLRKVSHHNTKAILPAHSSYKSLANKCALFFCEKIRQIMDTFPTSGSSTDAPTLASPAVNAFESASEDEVCKTISDSPTKSHLLDPIYPHSSLRIFLILFCHP